MKKLDEFLDHNNRTEKIKQELLEEYSINKTDKDFFVRNLSKCPWFYSRGKIHIILDSDSIFSTDIDYIYKKINKKLDFKIDEKIAILDQSETTLGFVSNYNQKENNSDLIIVSLSEYRDSLEELKNVISNHNRFVTEINDHSHEHMYETGNFSLNAHTESFLQNIEIEKHRSVVFGDLVEPEGFLIRYDDFKNIMLFKSRLFDSEKEYNFQKAKLEKEDLLNQKNEIDIKIVVLSGETLEKEELLNKKNEIEMKIVILNEEINSYSLSKSHCLEEAIEARTIDNKLGNENLDDDFEDDFEDELPF